MLKVQEIRELIKLVDQSSLDEFVYEYDGAKIKMKKNVVGTVTVKEQITPVAPAPVSESKPEAVAAVAVKQEEKVVQQQEESKPSAVDTTNLYKITSPMVGTFYASPSPDADVYVKLGSRVSIDSVVCIVEAMKLFNEIEAEVNGEIVEVLVKDGQLVEYGQPLFLVKPE